MPAPEIQALVDGDVKTWLLEVSRKLGFQGGPALNAEGTSCRYRRTMPDGSVRRCAVGVSISGAAWTEDLEGHNGWEDEILYALGLGRLDREVDRQRVGRHLGEAQKIHDNTALHTENDALFADYFPGNLESKFVQFVTADEVRAAYQQGVNERQIANDAS